MASAKALHSSVLPTPVGPRKIKEPMGRFGSFKPTRPRRMALAMARDSFLLSDDTLVQGVLQAEQPLALLLGELGHRHAGPHGDDVGNVGSGTTTLLLRSFLEAHSSSSALQLVLKLLLLVAERGGPLEVLGVDSGCLVDLQCP